MKKEVIIAGFGGQGVMTIGKNLVEAGVEEGYAVSWVPSYGPEMRGGSANCSVIMSDERIGAPIVEMPTELIAMNHPSMEKFLPKLKTGGTVFVNSSVIKETVPRDDVRAVYVPCDEIALELGNGKVSNMVMLGAYVGATGILKTETIEKMIEEMFTGKKEELIPLNKEAFARGIACTEGK